MVPRVLCVAEKPSIAKAVAQHLAGGQFTTVGRCGCITGHGFLDVDRCVAQYTRKRVHQELRIQLSIQSAMGELLCHDDKRVRSSHGS